MSTLGPYELNTIITGDARELAKAIPDESVDLIIADPPYYRIANEGWDKQWRSVQEWADWCLEWATEACRVLKPNGSVYIFGDDKNIAYAQVRLDALAWGLLNHIVWSKTNYTMLKSDPDALRSYQIQGEEHILFYGKDIAFPSFSEIRNPRVSQPMAQYLRQERERAGVTAKEVAALFPSRTGGLTGCISNWELGLNFPLREQYEAIREYLNTNGRRPPEYLRTEYEELRRPFGGGRFTDIWSGPLISASHKEHVSHKPRWINDRMILSSSKPDAIVLDMFAGSGSACLSAFELGRHYIGFELDVKTAHAARISTSRARPPLFTETAPLFVPEMEQLSFEVSP